MWWTSREMFSGSPCRARTPVIPWRSRNWMIFVLYPILMWSRLPGNPEIPTNLDGVKGGYNFFTCPRNVLSEFIPYGDFWLIQLTIKALLMMAWYPGT